MDKDNFGMINLEFSCFNDLAELVDSLPVGAKITGEGTLKNKTPYSKDAKQEVKKRGFNYQNNKILE